MIPLTVIILSEIEKLFVMINSSMASKISFTMHQSFRFLDFIVTSKFIEIGETERLWDIAKSIKSEKKIISLQ